MKIGITLKRNAYTPEAFAYEEYLSSKGHIIQLDYELETDNDINIYFMGIRPFYKKNQNKVKIIHEYQSLSTAPFARTKDIVKRYINEKPDSRIFLNKSVADVYSFNDEIPYICRDMGIPNIYFQTRSLNPIYDVVYCGSIANRYGIDEAFLSIAAKGLKLAVIGEVSKDFIAKFVAYKNVVFLGRMDSLKIAEVYKVSRFGLNYTPDIYPFNIQTSTKTLEYLASGLQLITNNYFWIENFCKKIKYSPVYLNNFLINSDLSSEVLMDDKQNNELKKYSWNNILDNSGLENFLNLTLNGA